MAIIATKIKGKKFAKTKAIEHLNGVVTLLQSSLNGFGIKVTAPLGPSSKSTVSFENNEHFDGMVYGEQVKAFEDVLSAMLHKVGNKYKFEQKHICLTSLTQVGKTTLLNLFSFLGPCIELLTGTNCMFVRLLINDCALQDQTEDEANNFIELYGEIVFSRGGKEWTVKSFMETLRLEIRKKDGRELNLQIKNFGGCMRTSASQIAEFSSLMDACERKGLNVIVGVDESHARARKDSILFKMLSSGHSQLSNGKAKHWLDGGLSFIGVSASNFAVAKGLVDDGYKVIFLAPGDNYTGFPWEPVEGKKVKVAGIPKIFSFASFDGIFGTCLASYRAELATNMEKYERTTGLTDWVAYRKGFIGELGKAINYLISKNLADGRGIIIRLCQNNDHTEGVREQLSLLHRDIEFKCYNTNADESGKLCLKKFIKRECQEDRPYVIFVTGRGRMGTAAPCDLRYGFDFSACPHPDFQVLIQGIAGRLTGYNKGIPWVILSKANADMLNNYIQTGEIAKNGKTVSPYKSQIGINSAMFDDHVNFKRDAIPFECLSHLTDVVKRVAKVIPDSKTKTKYKIRRIEDGYVLPWNPLTKWLSDPKILRPRECWFKANSTEMVSQNGKVQIAIRLDGGSYTFVTDKNARRKKGGQTKYIENDEHDVIDRRPIITVNKDVEIQEIWFPKNKKEEEKPDRIQSQYLKNNSAYNKNFGD